MIDVLKDELFNVYELTERLPAKPSTATIYHWWKYGKRGHKLETIDTCNKRYTTSEAVNGPRTGLS